MAERTKDLVVSVLGKRAAAVALTLDRGNRHRADQVATLQLLGLGDLSGEQQTKDQDGTRVLLPELTAAATS
jgi:hypothetical protein